MITSEFFIQCLGQNGCHFFTGVPDSLLKSLCFYLDDNCSADQYVVAANEGGAMGIAAGYYLSTGRVPVVFMQNSGEGNIVNPLLSLFDPAVYAMPCLLIIGWRGEPGVKDEPQHITQGRLTLPLLETMGVDYDILPDNELDAAAVIRSSVMKIQKNNSIRALIVRKNTFDSYARKKCSEFDFELSREQAIRIVADSLPNDAVIVSTTGMISRELFELREANGQEHNRDFLTVGAMGHASQIALGIAMNCPQRPVYCFDGDGAALMHMGGMAIVGTRKCENFNHIIFNNAAHDSVGGIPTVADKISFPEIAKACCYPFARTAVSEQEIISALHEMKINPGPCLLEIKVKTGNRKDLGRPTTTPVQNRDDLMKNLLQN